MNSTKLATLIVQAQAQVVRFPQYADTFQDARLVRVTSEVKTKMGVAFAAGEEAIMLKDEPRQGFVTLWSMRNAIGTSVPVSKVTGLQEARVRWTTERRGSAKRNEQIVPAHKLNALLARIEKADGFQVEVSIEA
jgi:hypothetical protein